MTLGDLGVTYISRTDKETDRHTDRQTGRQTETGERGHKQRNQNNIHTQQMGKRCMDRKRKRESEKERDRERDLFNDITRHKAIERGRYDKIRNRGYVREHIIKITFKRHQW